MIGTAQGAEAVHSIVVAARTLYEDQVFSFVGDYDDNAYIEEYSCNILGHPTRVVVTVHRNDAGKTQSLAVLHRPNTSVVVFSRAMHDKFADTPWPSTSSPMNPDTGAVLGCQGLVGWHG